MTFTIKRSTAVILIAVAGIICGLGIAEATNFFTSKAEAVAPYVPPFEKEVAQINKNLKAISQKLGSQYSSKTVLEELSKIRELQYKTCSATGGIGCSPF